MGKLHVVLTSGPCVAAAVVAAVAAVVVVVVGVVVFDVAHRKLIQFALRLCRPMLRWSCATAIMEAGGLGLCFKL